MLQMVSRTGNIQDHKQEQLRMQKEHLEQSKKQMENTDLQYMHPDQVQKYQGNVLQYDDWIRIIRVLFHIVDPEIETFF